MVDLSERARTRKQIRTTLQKHARTIGCFLKPVSHMFFRVMRYKYDKDPHTKWAGVKKGEDTLLAPTKAGKKTWKHWYDLFKTIPDRCSGVNDYFTKRTLLTTRNLEGVLLLKSMGPNADPVIVGFCIWETFNNRVLATTEPLNRHRIVDWDAEQSIDTQTTLDIEFQDDTLQEMVINSRCARIILVCTQRYHEEEVTTTLMDKVTAVIKQRVAAATKRKEVHELLYEGKRRYHTSIITEKDMRLARQIVLAKGTSKDRKSYQLYQLFYQNRGLDPAYTRGAGSLLMLYSMYHLLYATNRDRQLKYDGILLEVSNGTETQPTRARERRLIRNLPSTRLYTYLGFKEALEVNAYDGLQMGVVEWDDVYDAYRMALKFPTAEDREKDSILDLFTHDRWGMTHVLNRCASRPTCI